jgi:hypothetical protein
MDFSFDEPEFLDPADWSLASYLHHPVDDLEPLPDHHTEYRDAALECMKILRSVDVFMSRAGDPRLGLAEREIARQLGVTEQALRRSVGKFVRLANLDPAGGLRPLGQPRSNGGPALKENGQRGL